VAGKGPLSFYDGRVDPDHDEFRLLRRKLGLSTAPRRAAAGVALQARAVADHGEIAAFGAGFADVAFHPRFGALLGDGFDLGREARADAKRGAFGEFALERSRALDEAAMRA
jgi:hypothetical protein